MQKVQTDLAQFAETEQAEVIDEQLAAVQCFLI